MNHFAMTATRLERWGLRRLAPHQARLLQTSINLLRVSLGLVFLIFGLLKFVPGLSPAEGLAAQTMERLTFGLIPDQLGLIVVAGMETIIGLCLLSGRYLRLGLMLLAIAMVGILSPLVLFTGEMFAGPSNGPTLVAQYVFKDIVLLASALVITAQAVRQRAAARSLPPGEIRELHRQGERSRSRRWVAAVLVLALLSGAGEGAVANAAQASFPGTPADPAAAHEVIAAVERIFACFAAGEMEQVAALATDRFLTTGLGMERPEDAVEHMAGFFPFSAASIGTVRTHADGTVSADVVYRREEGQHMLVHERWSFVRQGDALLLDAMATLPLDVEGPVTDVGVRMVERGFELSQTELPSDETLRFTVTNAREGGADFAIFQLPPGITIEDVPEAGLPSDHRFMGAVFVEAGGQGELVLVDLEPGVYAAGIFVSREPAAPLSGFTVR